MAEKPWGGVFHKRADRLAEQFTESISFDQRLYAQDIRCSVAHAQMLASVGLLTAGECQQIEQSLDVIRQQIEQGSFDYRVELEDIHMHIEVALIERLGDIGRKLHTARSRNDQVSTDLRLWVRESIDELDAGLCQLQTAFVARCSQDRDVILPAYTHMRRAQPVLAPHYWLAYSEKFQRDRDRLADCRRRVNVLPLGTAALAGTSLPIDRQDVARRLGFDSVTANSLDSSSDRDFAVEFVFAMTLVAEHLSTWAEEWIIWSTTEFDFLDLPQEFCTGSSIMPQKINPDVLELIRGKTARVVGDLQTLLVLVKGLPLAYNRDLQEDKLPVFDAFDTVMACVHRAKALVDGARLKVERIARAIDRGYLDATTLMEYLIRCDVPQRKAHEIVGRLVKKAMDRDARLADLSLDEFREVHSGFDNDVYEVLGIEQAVEAFISYGSTGPQEVDRQIAIWRQRLELSDAEPVKEIGAASAIDVQSSEGR